ncbi:stage V sporulation protein AE, C-terminal region (plasmid) [Bacillus cereus E33L]|uniref:Stage V sporulation protein AE, C-terminal region n=1 Tax=Bacillus cereus (strain ZK / E33L) TaxID=288681 RepID=Q4V160_BACCZ|nr:stage V sporulation protein AE, C-terminal region [Bacillus cereus E33L]
MYEQLIDFTGAGATVPITSFGNVLVHGAMEEAAIHGIVGVITSMFKVTSAGVSASIICGFIVEHCYSNRKDKECLYDCYR